MVTSSLPRYPRPEPPALPVAPTNGRGWFLFLQLATIIAFWVGIYLVRDKARAFSAAYRRAEERAKEEEQASAEESMRKRGIVGLWRLSLEESLRLELLDGRFKFLRGYDVTLQGKYRWWSSTELELQCETRAGVHVFLTSQCSLNDDELVLWDTRLHRLSDENWVFFLSIQERGAIRLLRKENRLRFRRISH